LLAIVCALMKTGQQTNLNPTRWLSAMTGQQQHESTHFAVCPLPF